MMRRAGILLTVLVLSTSGSAASQSHWSYLGRTGPSHWGSIEPDYATCGTGKEQSPINIETAKVRRQKLPPLAFDYHRFALHIIDNGHTIQVDVPTGSSLTVAGHRYALVQFHFHRPSEETVDGRSSAMVAHLVHRDAKGQLAVVAVLLNSGRPNPLLSEAWRHLPRDKGHEFTSSHVTVNPAQLLPSGRKYYTFRGSLTTPPCSEHVRWFVLKSPASISTEQLAIFGKHYPSNARPVQPLNGRVVLSDS